MDKKYLKQIALYALTTVISVFAGVIFLGEPFGWISLAASVVIIAGVWGVQRG